MKNLLPAVLFLFIGQLVSAQNTQLNLMPYPQSVKMTDGSLKISSAFTVNILADTSDKIMEAAGNRLFRRLNARTQAWFEQEKVDLKKHPDQATLTIRVKQKTPVSVNADETYSLSINATNIALSANTTIGALRGIETLLQLVYADGEGYHFPAVEIQDAPRFKWRGMMVDPARHFIPLDILKKNIDAMAMVKMNVLHLHLTDDEGFRVESKLFPKLQQLGSNGQYYTQAELKGLVNYAAERGIMVYPEFDLPGHSQSWFAGYPELASAPGPYEPGPRFKLKPGASLPEIMQAVQQAATPTINPAKEQVYQFLDKFIGEMTSIFPSPYLHIGADENNGIAWKNNPQIVQFMKDKGIKDTHELQAYFVKRLYEIAKKHKRTMIGWEELFTPGLPQDVVVQAWVPEGMGTKMVSPEDITTKGNPVIISRGFYLDLFMPAYIHYLNPTIPSTFNIKIWGGEAALWSELVDEYSFEGRAWPRTAAIAERFWSPEQIKDVDDMYRRLFVMSDRLEEAGLNHRLNVNRMLLLMNNEQDINPALTLLQTIGPLKGYKRLFSQMTKPPGARYQQTPLVGFADILSCDSKQAWEFRKLVEAYTNKKDLTKKAEIASRLSEWQKAALQIEAQYKNAPGLNSLSVFASRIAMATNIGLQALENNMDEGAKKDKVAQLNGMKNKTDEAEIRILGEIEALVTGLLAPLPQSYPMF